MAKKYQTPPIIEAVCEFRFEPSAPWDLTIPGLVYERVRKDFPKRSLAALQELRIEASPGGFKQSSDSNEGMQFSREKENVFIRIARDILSVNYLKPYATWDAFCPLIHQAFEAYREVAKPAGIRRVGLRYINRIEIPGSPVKLEDHLHFYPFLAPHLPQTFGDFLVAIAIPYNDSRDILRLQTGSAPVQAPDRVGLLLDLDYFLATPGAVAMDSVSAWVQLAHDRVEEIFEGCITDPLRKVFEEVTL